MIKTLLLKTYENIHLVFLPLNFNFLTIVFLYFYASETAGIQIRRKSSYFVLGILEFVIFTVLFILGWFNPAIIENLFLSGFMDVYMISSAIFIGYFCIQIIRINFKHAKRLPQYYKDKKYKTLHWLTFFCGICLLLNTMGLMGRFLYYQSEAYYIAVEITYLISLYYITIASLIQININNVIGLHKQGHPERELIQVCVQIDTYMTKERLYLNPSLNLKLFSNHVNISDRLISKSINEIKHKNFNTFVHEYRIEEFKKLVKNEKYIKYSIEALAQEVGYNSRASFYKNFKKIVGVSPLDYINDVKSQPA